MEATSRREFLAAGAAATVRLVESSAGRQTTLAERGLLQGKIAVIYGAAGASAMTTAAANLTCGELAH
jgi:hypothetical protein